MTDFPVLDSSRDDVDGRVVLCEQGSIEPYIAETDWWCSMPLRVAHDPLSGVVLEIGPYSLNERDIAQLRAAIRSWDVANHGPRVRRIK